MTAPFTPRFVVPNAPGPLSNKRGSNTGADALALSTQYSHPNSTDHANGIRVTTERITLAGTAPNAWNDALVILNGRLYVYSGARGVLVYAPINPDGRLGGWSRQINNGGFQNTGNGSYMVGFSDGVTAWLLTVGAATAYYAP